MSLISGKELLEKQQERWLELVGSLDASKLAEEFAFLISTVPDYDPPPVPITSIHETAKSTFLAMIEQLTGGSGAGYREAALQLGVVRARAGIPITSLMSAIRLDFTVLWNAITRISTPEDAELVVKKTPVVLQTVDDYAMLVQRSYTFEIQRIERETTSAKSQLIAGLFQDPAPTEDRLESIADGLGVPMNGKFTVIAAVGSDIPELQAFLSLINRLGATTFEHHYSDTLVAFFRLSQLSDIRQQETVERMFTLRAGVRTPCVGLEKVRDEASTARNLAHLLKEDEQAALTWGNGWVRVARQLIIKENHPLLSDVNEALAGLGEAERNRLVEAVENYLETGSISQSAENIFCHRNTLSNRLRRFAEITGLDPLIPKDAARLVVGWSQGKPAK